MKKSRLLIILIISILISGSSLYAQSINTVPTAFSPDGNSIIFEDIDSTEGVGGNPGSRFRVVDIVTGNILNTFETAYNYELENPWDAASYEEIIKLNHALRTETIAELENQGFIFDDQLMTETSLPMDVRLEFSDKGNIDSEKSWLYELSFYLHHEKTGMISDTFSVRIHEQRDSKSSNNGIYDDEDFLGIPWTTIDEDVQHFAGTNIYLVGYTTPAIDFYYFGSQEYIAIPPKTLSYFYNDIGISIYYPAKEYYTALEFFELAAGFNPESEVALYNSACMYGLLGDEYASVEQLKELRKLNTNFSQQRLNQARSDSDFDSIREGEIFIDFLRQINR